MGKTQFSCHFPILSGLPIDPTSPRNGIPTFLTRTPRRFCSFCTMRCNSTCETKREITCVNCVHLYTDLHVVYIYMWLSIYLYIYIYMYICMYICVGITRRAPEQSRTPSWRYLIQDQGSKHSGIIPSGDSPTRWKIWKKWHLRKTHLSPSGFFSIDVIFI